MKRVCCLYRVSTHSQADKDKERDVIDIPMQEQVCREFAQRQGWQIVDEFTEVVSGFKVSAKDRDAIQDIQKAAIEKRFDTLLVYMFDRIGRIHSETPFVVKWLVENGIDVWSASEGQQKFDNHTDDLINFLRYWQAAGESIKTSMRTKAGLAQTVKDGHFRGGFVPYGYKLVKNGRKNKRQEEVGDLEVDPYEAEIVKLIFHKYVYEGYGINRLINYLSEQKIFNHFGNKFSFSSTLTMVQNPLYIGIITSGDTRSDVIPHLQIIDNDLFERAQMIRVARSDKREDIVRSVPYSTKGKALLAGIVYCGHCGGRLSVSTAPKKRIRTDGSVKETRRDLYKCHSKNLKLRDCDGQTGYSMQKIDNIVTEVLLSLFDSIKALSVNELVEKRFKNELLSCETKVKGANKELLKLTEDLKTLQGEVVKAIAGESKFDSAVLNDLILEAKEKIAFAEKTVQQYEEEFTNCRKYAEETKSQYKEVIEWSEMFQGSTRETKKMIAAYLIDSVEVRKGYDIKIKFNVAYEQFNML